MNPKFISLLAALLTLGAAATAHAEVFHGTISVTQTAASNAGTQLELQAGSSTGVSLPTPPNPNRGDYFLDFPGDVGVGEGVLITSIARNDVQNGNFHTSSAAFGLTGGNFDPNQYFVSVHTSEPDSEEGNSDTAFAFFDYDDWLGGTLLEDANSGDINGLVASPGIFFGNGAEVSPIAQGIHRVNLQNIANSSSQNGILLVNGAKNEDNFALSRANDDGSFTVFCHDNGENGEVYEEDPVNFVYINENDIGRDGLVAMGRVMSDGTMEVSGGSTFASADSTSRAFTLFIEGSSSDSGTLIISPEGGQTFNLDNIVSYQGQGGAARFWFIQSRDITDNQARPLQANPDPEPVFSFAFFRSTITVTTTDDENDLNPFEDSGDISLREAVNQGAPGSRILFDPTLEGETITLDMGALDINKSLAIVDDLPNRVTIDANQQSRVMEIQPGVAVSLQGLNLTGGTTSGSGGAILNNSACLSLSSCTLSGNSAEEDGGSIYNDGSGSGSSAELRLTACTISGNSAEDNGGGIYSDGTGGSATLSLTRCTLSGNSASTGAGGGIFSSGSSSGNAELSLSECTLSGNSASGNGGGILASSSGNQGSATLSLSQCTLSGNSAEGSGGGIFNNSTTGSSATLNLSNSTLSGNSAGDEGGGVLSRGAFGGSAALSLDNSILAGNTANTGPDLREDGDTTITASSPSNGRNLIGDVAGSTLQDGDEGVIVAADPRLAPLGDYGGLTQTMHPLAGSPAILSGDDTTRRDQRDISLTGPPTIGAVKRGPIFTVTNSSAADPDSLRDEIIQASNSRRAIIRFDESLDSNTITLDGTQLVVPGAASGLFIDASNLPNGLTIDANQRSRVMEIQPGAIAALHGLTLTGGVAPEVPSFFGKRVGGAIFNNNATLSLSACTLSGNSAGEDGGGIFSRGSDEGSATLSLSACTLSGNSAGLGGGLFCGSENGSATLSLSACTLSGNSAVLGGGIFSESFGEFGDSITTLSLKACTLSGNFAGEEGGGIYNSSSTFFPDDISSATLSLSNSILAGNTASAGPDLREFDDGGGTASTGGTVTTTATGSNLISSLAGQTSLTEDDVTLLTTPLALAPLAHYGGPTQTMHPLAGSPAILSGDDTTRTDQRGFTLTGPPTIGAVKLGPVAPVSSESTLRNALTDFGGIEGQVIRFEEGTAPITLTGDQFIVPGTANGLFIEASELPNGLTIDANGTEASPRRVMEIQPGAIAALHGLTLTGGVAPVTPSVPDDKVGGAIYNNRATLSLSACTLSGNSADFGGGIFSNGSNGSATLSLSACTLSGNSARTGGGILSNGGRGSATLSLSACTLSGNSADGQGGGIFSNGSAGNAVLSLNSCTLSGNSAGTDGDGGGIFSDGSGGNAKLSLSACTLSGNSATRGGGIATTVVDGGSATLSLSACTLSDNSATNEGGGISSIAILTNASVTLNLSNNIIAGNTASTGPDLRVITISSDSATTTTTGNNLISSLAGQTSLTEDDVTLLTTPLALAPLGHYGGPTQTRPPLPGSPAIDTAGTTNPGGTDQRGFPRFFNGMLDIGAVEFQGNQAELDLAFEEDIDGDGTSVGVELAIGTDPLVSDPGDARKFRLTGINQDGDPTFTFGVDDEQQNNIILSLVRSTDLVDFTTVIMSNASSLFDGPGAELLELDDTDPPAGGKAFYRLEAERRPIQQP